MIKEYQPEEAPENPKPPKGGSETAPAFDEVLFMTGHWTLNENGLGVVYAEEEGGGPVSRLEERQLEDITDLFKRYLFPEIDKPYRARVSVRNGAILFERLRG